MSLISKIRSWFRVKDLTEYFPPGTKFAFTSKEVICTNFDHGVEIFNDDTTTIEFVVDILMNHFGLKKSDAIQAMMMCHNYGSVVLPLKSDEEAVNIIEKINEDIRESGHSLVCKLAIAQQVAPTDAKKRRG